MFTGVTRIIKSNFKNKYFTVNYLISLETYYKFDVANGKFLHIVKITNVDFDYRKSKYKCLVTVYMRDFTVINNNVNISIFCCCCAFYSIFLCM